MELFRNRNLQQRQENLDFFSISIKNVFINNALMKKAVIFLTILATAGCYNTKSDLYEFNKPEEWTVSKSSTVSKTTVKKLKKWWTRFDDKDLNYLIKLALKYSPDSRLSKARIQEARGAKKSEKSRFFPEFEVNGTRGRERVANFGPNFEGVDDFFDSTLDASYEIDVFGRVRNSVEATQRLLEQAEANYHDVNLSLAGEVTSSYIDYRLAQNQLEIALNNLDIQERTLKLIKVQRDVGEAPQLDD